MKFAIATLLSLIAAQSTGTFSAGTFTGLPDNGEAITVVPFTHTDFEKFGEFTPITDCSDEKCLLDDERWLGKEVLVGLRFTEELETHNPDKKGTDEDVFDIYSKVKSGSTKRVYDGAHILAQDHVVKIENDELVKYIKFNNVNAEFLKKSHITLPVTYADAVFDEILPILKDTYAQVFVNIKDEDLNSDNLVKNLERFKDQKVAVIATQDTAKKVNAKLTGLDIKTDEKHYHNVDLPFATDLPICKA